LSTQLVSRILVRKLSHQSKQGPKSGWLLVFKDSAVDQIWNKVPEAEPAQDWFTSVIRMALYARVEGIEPAPTTWDTVRRRIEALVPSLPHQGEVCKRRRQDV
jgi:hypothetical protein